LELVLAPILLIDFSFNGTASHRVF
jgi:hypothetical protein